MWSGQGDSKQNAWVSSANRLLMAEEVHCSAARLDTASLVSHAENVETSVAGTSVIPDLGRKIAITRSPICGRYAKQPPGSETVRDDTPLPSRLRSTLTPRLAAGWAPKRKRLSVPFNQSQARCINPHSSVYRTWLIVPTNAESFFSNGMLRSGGGGTEIVSTSQAEA